MRVEKSDIKELKRMVPIRQVLAAEGIMSKKDMILCPSPVHCDKHLGSCIVNAKSNRVHCYACGETFDSLSIIMIKENLDFNDAVIRLAEMAGKLDELEEKDKERWKQKKRHPQKPLHLPTERQRKMLGLASFSGIMVPKNLSFEGEKWDRQADGLYLVSELSDYNPEIELATNNKEAYDMMIRNKAYEKRKEYEALLKAITDPETDENGNKINLSKIAYAVMGKCDISVNELVDVIKESIKELNDIREEFRTVKATKKYQKITA